MIGDVLRTVMAGEDLPAERVEAVMNAMLGGELGPASIAAFLVALRMKGETVAEIAAAARVMRQHATRIEVPGPLVDTCGTGGDRSGTFNLSTAAALTAAACGVRVAKHGNRSVSSKSGSADVLEALGVRLDVPVDRLPAVLEAANIAFLFAPAHHGATRHAVGPRRELGVRTVFNVLGPLTNPAGATRQVMGVFAADLVEPIAQVLAELGAEHAIVVHGHGGLDEVSLAGPTSWAEARDGVVRTGTWTPEGLGVAAAPLSTLAGGDASENAAILRAIFAGERGPRADAVALNAGPALYVAGAAASPGEGVATALEALHAGRVAATLSRLVAATA